jgi:hypothetical protein
MKCWEDFIRITKQKSNNRHSNKNRPSGWSTNGVGMSKHYHSGMSKHKKFAIIRCREANKILSENKTKRTCNYDSVGDLFDGYDGNT